MNLLRQRNFSLLWWAGMISITGDWALRVALPIYVLRLTGSPSALAAVVLASLSASLLVGSVAGAHVDRWDRRRVLVVTNVLQALAVLPLLAVQDATQAWIAVIVAFAESALAQYLGPAESALLPRLVNSGELAAANSLNGLNNFLGRLIGPALGGAVAATTGLVGAVVLDGVSFVVAALLCALITGTHRAERHDERGGHVLREMADGMRTAAARPIVRAILIFITVISIGEGMMRTLFVVYVTDALHVGGREMGWLLSAQAVGGILGSLFLSSASGTTLRHRFRPVALAATCYALFGVMDLVIFNYPRVSDALFDGALWPVVVMFFLLGPLGAIAHPTTMTLLQTQLPDHLRGRVFAAMGVCEAVAGMIGAAIAGVLAPIFSVLDLLTLQGAGFVVAALLMRLLAGEGPPAFAHTRPGG